MITGTEMYWLTRLDYLQGFVIGLSVVWLILTSVALLVSFLEYDGEWVKWGIILSFCGVLLLLGGLLIPNTKEYCAIKIIPTIINNNQVQELPNKVVELANEWIDELKPSKESE